MNALDMIARCGQHQVPSASGILPSDVSEAEARTLAGQSDACASGPYVELEAMGDQEAIVLPPIGSADCG